MYNRFLFLPVLLVLGACGSSGGDDGPVGGSECTAGGQKSYVLDAMRAWYLWNDRLPTEVDLNQYPTAEDLLAFLTTFSPPFNGQPVDRFSFINSAEADAEFFGEGRFEGFGLSFRAVAADDIRLTRVFDGSPADLGGLARGQRILALNGRSVAEIQAAEGVSAVLDTSPVDFTIREIDGSEFEVTIARDIVTIDPVPQWRIIDLGGGQKVGYLELSSFISTANEELSAVFASFRAANVSDVIIDLRYNGGGLVSTAKLLGDFLGGLVAQNLVFSQSLFNDDRAAENNRTEFFALQGDSVNLSRLVVIATASTASASELVVNGMEPHVDVTIVGADTFGKPVGQVGLEFCDKILRPTAFQLVNALDFGDYFDGLPADCPAPDDLDVAIGADDDPNMIAALYYLQNNACPLVPAATLQQKPIEDGARPDRRGPPHRELLDAY